MHKKNEYAYVHRFLKNSIHGNNFINVSFIEGMVYNLEKISKTLFHTISKI